MATWADEISAIIEQNIAGFGTNTTATASIGTVISVQDGVARIYGLQDVKYLELVEFPRTGLYGMAFNLEEETVSCPILGDYTQIREDDEVRTTGRVVEVPVGDALLGRVVNPLGQPVEDRGPIATDKYRPVERVAPGVITRRSVNTPVQTGIKAIDSMIPIGRGQRELIIGDRQTGKTAIMFDTIINQKGKDLFCIYVAIGQNAANIARVRATLEEHGAMEYTTIVAATASEPAALAYIAPYAGCAMGEYFRDRGQHALVCYDDLTKHAWAYRELSLTLRRPPGREAYPGDVFYLHSRLLERAPKLSRAKGGGSLTALPVIETQANDVSAYIPTNVISITDGQIYLEADLFNAGVRPAISVGLSVSRVGGDAQTRPMSKTAGRMKSDLAQARELAAFAAFASDLDPATKRQLELGQRLTQVLIQQQFQPVRLGVQVCWIYAGTRGFLDGVPVDKVGEWKEACARFAEADRKDLLETIESGAWNDEVEGRLREAIEAFNQQYGVDSPRRES